MKLLENKVAIITGGTRGIGFATVEAFLKQGAKVAMCGSRQETVDKALEKLSEYSDSLMGICPKLDDAESVGAAFDEVVARFGKVDILINNAGLAARGLHTTLMMKLLIELLPSMLRVSMYVQRRLLT